MFPAEASDIAKGQGKVFCTAPEEIVVRRWTWLKSSYAPTITTIRARKGERLFS